MRNVERVELVDGGAVVWRTPRPRTWRAAVLGALAVCLPYEAGRLTHWAVGAALAGWALTVLFAAWGALHEDLKVRSRPAAEQFWVYDLLRVDGRVGRVGIAHHPAVRVAGYAADGWAAPVMRPVRAFWTRRDALRWETQRIQLLVAVHGGDHANIQKAGRAWRTWAGRLLWLPAMRCLGFVVPEMSLRRRDRKAVAAAARAQDAGSSVVAYGGSGSAA